MHNEQTSLDDEVQRAWRRFTAYLMVRLRGGDYSRAIGVVYVDGVPRHELPPAIQLSRSGHEFIALGSQWLAPSDAQRIAELPGYRVEHGRLRATDTNHARLVSSTVQAFREILGVPHPAFLEVRGVDQDRVRSFRSPYVEQDLE
ncbi:TY-Chap domain-containing protein [Nocardioides jensenii]|uniref:TY-Chap domain-containing protein n=1 Tax=Nocardioides jensenii TaxID=1843 RepID=UPI000ABF8FC9|nr:hypothetical protein [Nocardioides jensenii]